jgi:uncharacterized protein
MNLEKIQKKLEKALKEKDEVSSSVFRMLISEIRDKEKKKRYNLFKEGFSEKEIDLQGSLSEEEINNIFISEAKKRKESIREFEKGARLDLVEKEKKELDILKEYLPEDISIDELKKIISEVINESKEKEIGKIMPKVMAIVKGRINGSEVSSLVRKFLN